MTTPTTSNPSPISARSGGAAKSGVPQKSTRTLELLVRMLVIARVGSSLELSNEPGYLSLSFAHFAERRAAFQDAQVVDEQLAVQMIDLVLEAAREQVVGLDLERLLRRCPCARTRTVGRPLDVAVDVGNRQTAFFGLRLPVGQRRSPD